MKKLVFASNNPNKVKEVATQLGDQFEIVSLKEAGIEEDIPETQSNLEGNARQKAHFIKDKYGFDCFADDTGLEVKALDGEPGVLSARYAGRERDSEANMDKVLNGLEGELDRSAQFRTVICLLLNGEEHLFEGVAVGNIREKRSGSEGFGYDPIFEPKGFDITFAEMDMAQKNEISHRGKAVAKLVEFLSNQ
ncbi:non-canonical purine NTP diphosphatase [Halocola ammonii]